jgi:hypothetical protein
MGLEKDERKAAASRQKASEPGGRGERAASRRPPPQKPVFLNYQKMPNPVKSSRARSPHRSLRLVKAGRKAGTVFICANVIGNVAVISPKRLA